MKFDLHLHTTASDGTDSPQALVEFAASLGFQTIAITDHDTVSGVRAGMATGDALGIRVIPGVEISAGGDTEVHVLGYGIDRLDETEELLREMRRQRNLRMEKMVKKLEGLGISIPIGEVTDSAEDSVGRAHLARIMVERGEARDVKDAFSRYLSPGCPAYVPREKLTVGRAIRLIRSVGGLPVIAHPGLNREGMFWMEERLRAMMGEGLAGLEVYHPSHTPQQVRELDRLARRLGLLVTGGSDYHGSMKLVSMGDGLQGWANSEEDFARFIRQLDGRGLT